MTGLKDNLKRWREAAEIDWFSQFIKAWIPFNAWMTDTFGDLSDREMLDRIKAGNNVVYNRIIPMLSKRLPQARDTNAEGWYDDSNEARDFRLHLGELHRLLQSCLIESRRGRVSFETVDIGVNGHRDESLVKWTRTFRVRRDYPNKPQVTLEMTGTKRSGAFAITLTTHDRRELEDSQTFKGLKVEHRSTILALFDAVAPRRIISVLAPPGNPDCMNCGNAMFINDNGKVFSALIDVVYSLRNALFHGSITPNDTHNRIYEPAYHIVMRLVRCTL